MKFIFLAILIANDCVCPKGSDGRIVKEAQKSTKCAQLFNTFYIAAMVECAYRGR
jgi:hypothetical protein